MQVKTDKLRGVYVEGACDVQCLCADVNGLI